jgi:CRISPR-associated protein Cas5d
VLDREVVRLRVEGDLACFTRPEAKVERVSYPVMTPSAARGVLEAICWKPEFSWWVRRILVLKPIQFTSIRRNEVQGTIPVGEVRKWMRDPSTFEPYLADSAGRHGPQGENRTQRNTLALRDVAYVIEASVQLRNGGDATSLAKYREMFLRRAARGQCYHHPYLGIREYAAKFGLAQDSEQPIDDCRDLGRMFFDADYRPTGNQPLFAPAKLEEGVLDVEAMRRAAKPAGPEEVAP